jgi:hypothetical protein
VDAEQRAALVLLAGGLLALAAVLRAVDRPSLRLPAFAAVVFVAAAAFAVAVGLAVRL